MSDLIRMARRVYGPAYDDMMLEAGRIKNEYMQAGGDPRDVASPERIAALQKGGLRSLASEPAERRGDGTVAAPYVPTEMALATNIIEKPAVPVVREAMRLGINTASSGTDPSTGRGFAIGRAPDGSIVKLVS